MAKILWWGLQTTRQNVLIATHTLAEGLDSPGTGWRSSSSGFSQQAVGKVGSELTCDDNRPLNAEIAALSSMRMRCYCGWQLVVFTEYN
jgi:hypothetical protein